MDSEAATDPAAPPSADAPKPEKKESWWETLRFFLFLFVGALILRSLVFAPFNIPSGSMLPNLMIGDYLFVAKWPYGISRYSLPFGVARFSGRLFERLPERGDIVVFRYPGNRDEDLVKRVIGLPGDTIEVRGGVVILNGRALPRRRIADFEMPETPNSPCRFVGDDPAARRVAGPNGAICHYPRYVETLPGGRSYDVLDQGNSPTDNYPQITIPAGRLFVMGDNRDDSADSRVPLFENGVGLLPTDHVLGPAEIAFWSTDGSSSWIKPWTWFTAARWRRIGHLYE